MTVEELKKHLSRIQWQTPAGYLEKVLEFAERRQITDKLVRRLEYLNNYAGDRSQGCRVYKDAFPSFGFDMLDREGGCWFNGGCIYYGPGETGVGGPQFSVRIGSDLDEDWSINT